MSKNTAITIVANQKRDRFDASKKNFFLSGILAGCYISISVFLSISVGAYTQYLGLIYKIFSGISFAIGLILVHTFKEELFTGNVFILGYTYIRKNAPLIDILKTLSIGYFANILGTIIFSTIYTLSCSANSDILFFIETIKETKLLLPAKSLFWKGFLCNFLVCLAICGSIKLQEESARFTLIFLCLFAFITSGYEHSIANSTFFSFILQQSFSWNLFHIVCKHMLWVSLGNIAGGLFLAAFYGYLDEK